MNNMSKDEKKKSKKYKFPDIKNDEKEDLREETSVRPTRIKKA